MSYYSTFVSSWFAWRGRLPRTGVRVVQQPRVEPILMADAAMHLRIDPYGSPAVYPEETLIRAQISAAREYCEQYLGRSLAPQVLQWTAHSFPFLDYIELPFGPVLAVESVTYFNGTDDVVMSPATDYLSDTFSEPTRIYTLSGAAWPTITSHPGGVRVRYQAGYTTPGDSPDTLPLPFSLRAAILLVLGHLYENREHTSVETFQEIPLGAKSLMDPCRLRVGFA